MSIAKFKSEECKLGPVKIDKNGLPLYDYIRFPRRFVAYRWFKPIFTAVLTFVFMTIFQLLILAAGIVMAKATGGYSGFGMTYDDMDLYTVPGIIVNLGSIASMLPALALALRIVHARPFSSLSSSRGGWNWGAFFKCLIVAAILIVAISVIPGLFGYEDPDMDAQTGEARITVITAILIAILGSLQCISEEYIFRGFVLQTFGAWFRYPIIAIVLSAIVFALSHGYNLTGNISIFIGGVCYAIVAWQSRGLEASSAIHVANNLFAFYALVLGAGSTGSEVEVSSLIWAGILDVSYAAIVILLGKKFNWFKAKKDGTVKFNVKMAPKYQVKAAKKALKKAQKEAKRAGLPIPTSIPMPQLQFTQPTPWPEQPPVIPQQAQPVAPEPPEQPPQQ